MSTLILTRGLPGSGKTYWTKNRIEDHMHMGLVSLLTRGNRDDLRDMMFPGHYWNLTFKQEQSVTRVQQMMVLELLNVGYEVTVDDMHLRPKYINEWKRVAVGHTVEVLEFPTPIDICIQRDAARARSVGEKVIRNLAQTFMPKGEFLPVPELKPEDIPPPERYVAKPDTPEAIIVDIDGTLAHKGDRDIYDLSRVPEDTLNAAVAGLVQDASSKDLKVIFCTGREDSSREVTFTWLRENLGIPSGRTELLMRSSDDKRKDSIVKRELFDKHIRDNYDVKYVLDDRNQVVEMWRSLGLPCFQVAPGNF